MAVTDDVARSGSSQIAYVMGPDDIKVRVIGGGGADRYTDDARIGGLYVYDGRGNNTFADDFEAPVDERRYEEPPDYESPTEQSKPRDWGSRWCSAALSGCRSCAIRGRRCSAAASSGRSLPRGKMPSRSVFPAASEPEGLSAGEAVPCRPRSLLMWLVSS